MTILQEIDNVITKIDEANALFDKKDDKLNGIKKVLLDARKDIESIINIGGTMRTTTSTAPGIITHTTSSTSPCSAHHFVSPYYFTKPGECTAETGGLAINPCSITCKAE